MKKFLQKIEDSDIRKGLYYSVLDGVLWACMFGVSENYIVPFVILFGASVMQVSLLQGLSQLALGIAHLLGTKVLSLFKNRRQLSVITCRLHALTWVFVFALTAWTKNPWFAVVFFVAGFFFGNISGPSWLSWMNDLMPREIRGEYWGRRNRVMGITQLFSISFAGIFLQIAKSHNFETLAYGILFNLGFLFRYGSSLFLKRQHEPPMLVAEESKSFKFHIFIEKLFTTNFGRFVLFYILLSFTINLTSPIIPVYLLSKLKFNYLQYTVIVMIFSISNLLFMTYWGPLSDKFGNYRILIVTACTIPFLALGWTLFRSFPLLIFHQFFAGFTMAGFNLAQANYIFDAVRRENVSKIMGYFNMLNTLMIFLGTVAGGFLYEVFNAFQVEFWIFNPYTLVFLISAVLRGIVVLCFRKGFREVRQCAPSPPGSYFLIEKPAQDVLDAIQIMNVKVFQTPFQARKNREREKSDSR